MTKQYKPRIARIIFFAALAVMFWIFDLTTLAWIFTALFVLPFLIGGIVWIWKSINHQIKKTRKY